jgi:hypothetical protein
MLLVLKLVMVMMMKLMVVLMPKPHHLVMTIEDACKEAPTTKWKEKCRQENEVQN